MRGARLLPSPRQALFLAAVLVVALEGFLWLRFYSDVTQTRSALNALRGELGLESLKKGEAEVLDLQLKIHEARGKLASARAHVDGDPLLLVARLVPGLKDEVNGLRYLVHAAEESADTGLAASAVLLAYSRQVNDPNLTSLQEGVQFLRDQAAPMARARDGLGRMKAVRERISSRPQGPLGAALVDLDQVIVQFDGLVVGYERAHALLPDLLGFNGPRTYLVLPQNDTELFPSGGLISSYGIAVFENGRIRSMEFEYFVNLFDRWQKLSGGEYVEPPRPLKNYLKRHVSWALGEAGWFPDFPTTADLAKSFVRKGGGPTFDGTIALDLQFVGELLRLLGPVTIVEADVTVTADNISEVTLEQTRDESAVPGAQGKGFLGFLAKALLNRVFATSKNEWVDLLKFLDRMAEERHVQLHFDDKLLQRLNAQYGFDGSLIASHGDFLLVADTSVNSTKLNLILETAVQATVALREDGSALAQVTYTIANPFPGWRERRDPRLVTSLMLEGVYGSYLRVYANEDARLVDIRLDGQTAGAEQVGREFGKSVFGRFFPVLPGQTRSVTFLYETPGVVLIAGRGATYSLYVQKEAGTRAVPLSFGFRLPQGAVLEELRLDGRRVDAPDIVTDLRRDRKIEVIFRLP